MGTFLLIVDFCIRVWIGSKLAMWIWERYFLSERAFYIIFHVIVAVNLVLTVILGAIHKALGVLLL